MSLTDGGCLHWFTLRRLQEAAMAEHIRSLINGEKEKP